MPFVILSVSPVSVSVLCLAKCALVDFDIQKYYTTRLILFKPKIASCWKRIFLALLQTYICSEKGWVMQQSLRKHRLRKINMPKINHRVNQDLNFKERKSV